MDAYNRAKQILTDNIDKLHFIAEFLVRNEIMDGEQFKAAMEGNPTFEELEEMTEAKRRKSRRENEEKRQREAEEARRREEEAKAPNSEGENASDKKPDDIPPEGSDSSSDNIPF